jgi:hypothetical protein
MPKTLRFQDLVENAGRPLAVTLWTDPGSDPLFSRAIKENRVLTLIQPRTTKQKDYGIIGFHKDSHASYLMFPRILPEGGDLRVIGIKYELVDERPVGQVVLPKGCKARKFTIQVRRTATLDASITVLAVTREEAEKQALESVRKTPFASNDGVREETVITRVEEKA